MQSIEKEIADKFGERLRVRVNGILIEDDKILLIRHKMSKIRSFWSVPGGGMHFGSHAVDNLKREFLEETGLIIGVRRFLYVHEFLEPPLHALEMFFEVYRDGGSLIKGVDPELSEGNQIIMDSAFMDIDELDKIQNHEKHRMFWELNSLNDVRIWKGYFNFENNCIK